MADLGKVDRDFLDQYVFPRLGRDRDDVAIGPTHGVDFGLIDLDGTAVAIATDPVSVIPDLGFERAGRFALDFVLADVAVSGLTPSHLAISFTLPPEFTDEEFATLWGTIHSEADDLGISIVTGHTARYAECSFPWVGGATALAVGPRDDVIRPDGARIGDDVLVTKGPAVETTGLLTTLFPDQFDFDADTLAAAQARLDEAACVREAMTAAAVGGVTAMHDATECGLFGAFVEVATGAGVRLDLQTGEIPVRPGVSRTCEVLGIDPWTATTGGTLVLAVDPDQTSAVVDALEAEGVPVGVAGTVQSPAKADERGTVVVDGEPIDHPDVDPSWAAYEELARASEA